MQELEKLLNSLIARGWKRKGRREITHYKVSDSYIEVHNKKGCLFWIFPRELVSLESGLWQFVCENKLVKQSQKQRVLNPTFGPEGADCDWSIQSNDFQYRLLESVLVPEEELGKFLLDNIKIEGNSK